MDPLTCLLHHLCAMNSSDSPLVRHLLTSWRPAWWPSRFDPRLNFNCSFQVDASGECTVEYKVHGNHITKHKSDCRNLEIAGQFYNVNPVSTGVTVSNTPCNYPYSNPPFMGIIYATFTGFEQNPASWLNLA